MKYTITINQSAIFTNGLINKTDLTDWAIIDYLKDFAIYPKRKSIIHNREEYVWLNYQHLINSLPLVKIRSKMGIVKRISKLRNLGLIKTCQKPDNTLFYTFTGQLIDCLFIKKSNPVNSDNTPPVNSGYTGAVNRGYTAQYKTKNTIINKDYNSKETIFSSSFLKDQELKPKTTFTNNKPYKPIRKDKNGFKSMAGGIWNVLDNIRQRGKHTAMRDNTPAPSNLAVLTPGGHNDKAV